MTKDKLEAKLKELQAGQAQAVANVNAFNGAIQAIQALLTEVNAEEAKPVDPSTPSVN
jgi:cell fate (sporulation/competence/biofilm development) regulator YlbF (YheA/YmcA/DUF963 family)